MAWLWFVLVLGLTYGKGTVLMFWCREEEVR